MAVTLDQIVGEFWCGANPPAPWNTIDDWPSIISEAQRRYGGLASILDMIRRCMTNGVLELVLLNVRGMFSEILPWFLGSHVGDRLGGIPADLRGVIFGYLCVRRNVCASIETFALDQRHSFDDLPAYDSRHVNSWVRIWYRFGTQSRGTRPFIVVRNGSTSVDLEWESRCSRLRVDLATGVCCDIYNHEIITDTAIVAEAHRECFLHGFAIGAMFFCEEKTS